MPSIPAATRLLTGIVLAGMLGTGAFPAAGAAGLVPIPTLPATGTDATGGLLPDGAADPHWQLAGGPPGAPQGPSAWVVPKGFPIPPWLASGPRSRWIAPQASQAVGNPPGDYRYRLRFSLAGFDPATAVIRGRWSSDNAGTEVFLNGMATGLSHDGNFTVFSPEFTLATGFVPGTNTIEFVVNNAGDGANPTGFRAELSGTAEPEPPAGTPPFIRTQPGDIRVAQGAPARFTVVASGAPPLRYQWRLGGSPLALATDPGFAIPAANANWAGLYDVVVGNGAGAVTSRLARLEVQTPSPAERTWEPPGPSSRGTGIVLSEILVRPEGRADGRSIAFVELLNTNPYFEDLGGWRLSGLFDFKFPDDTRLAGNARLLVAPSPRDLSELAEIPADVPVLGGFPSPSAAAADRASLQLWKRSGALVLEVAWDAADPDWPAAAFGSGHALVLARPSLGESRARAWDTGARIGGSPGIAEPIPSGPLESAVLNEILATPAPGSTSPGFVEVLNRGLSPVDLSGCVLRFGLAGPGFRIPDGTVLAPGAALPFFAPELGLDPPPAGVVLHLITQDESRVLDAVRVLPQDPGVAVGRDLDDREPWRRQSFPSPGVPNPPPAPAPLVINEILAQPPSGLAADEFVELHNPGPDTLDLGGWEFTDGIGYEFPAGARLPPGAYGLVVADRERFLAAHPAIDPTRVFGPFTGSLANSGERIALSRPRLDDPSSPPGPATLRPLVEMADARYTTSSRGRRWADGGGSSLELIDPRSDPRLAPNWADSDESSRAPWTTIEASGVLNLAHPGVPQADQLQILLLGAGEALVDDVEVLAGGTNRITHGTFESGTLGWTFQGSHRPSRWEPDEGFDGRGSLRLVATDRGDHVANRARTPIRSPLPVGTPVTLRARVRWLAGHPEILLRLRNGSLEAAGTLPLPPFPGTPGEPNSRRLPNAPPAILDVRHHPVLPAAGEDVRVTARIADPDGLRGVSLHHRTDPGTTTATVPMTDDGNGADERAGDGVYTGLLPGRATGTLVGFRIVAEDAGGTAAAGGAIAVFPDGDRGDEALVRFGETAAGGAFGNYRLWMTRASHDRWAAREKMSNEDIPVTFVLGNHRAIHGAGAHYSGSSYTSPGYTSPTGALCGYDVRFPGDDPFLDDTRLILDWPVRDDTAQRETLMFWFLEQLGLPNLHRRHVILHVNGIRRGALYDDIQQPDRDVVSEWFPDDDEGSLWKTDCWNEFDDAGNRIDPCILNSLERFPATGPLKVARYRWNWRPRAVRGSANDFSDLFALVQTATATSNYLAAVETLIDADHWMRTFAMNDLASYWDAFGNPNAKNTFLYKPELDRWKLFSWDFDVGLGVFNDPPDAPLFQVSDPSINRMYQTPALVRRYWAALDEAVNGFFQAASGTALTRLLDAKFAAFREHGIAVADPAPVKAWITQRRNYLLAQLAAVQAPFAITFPANGSPASQVNPITLSGTAPVRVRHVSINGRIRPVEWTGTTRWTLRLALPTGSQTLTIVGLDAAGRPIPGDATTLPVLVEGPPPAPPRIRINEWMAANRETLPDPADGDFDDWFELFNADTTPVDLTGFSLTDEPAQPRRFVIPPGFVLLPGDFLLVWADGEPEQTRAGVALHTNFRLDRDGSDLALVDPLGRNVDVVRFGAQSPDATEGRWGDGNDAGWVPLSQPSPDSTNAPPVPMLLELGLRAVPDPRGDGILLSWDPAPGRSLGIETANQVGSRPRWIQVARFPPNDGTPGSFRIPVPPGATPRYFRLRWLAN